MHLSETGEIESRSLVLFDGDRRLENKEEKCEHAIDYYKELFTKEIWDQPSLDNLQFPMIIEAMADRNEKVFEEK